MAYGAAQRALLRTLLARGVVPLPEAELLLQEHGDGNTDVRDTVKCINEQIRPFQQSVKLATDELTNEQAIVLLSLGLDDITKSQGVFSQPELQFFRVLIEQIVTTDRRQVSGIGALNLLNTLKTTLSKHDAEKLLTTWCAMRYLDRSDGSYSLGLRSVHEFEGYLRRNMPDVMEECTLCKQIVFRGCNCPACGVAVHTRCLNRYLEKINNWPCCKAQFDGLPQPGATLARSQIVPDVAVAGTSSAYDTRDDASQLDDDTMMNTLASQESLDEEGLTQASQLGISQTSTIPDLYVEPCIMKVVIEGQSIEVEIDSGAGASILPYNLYKLRLAHVKLRKTRMTLKVYDGKYLEVVGEIYVKVGYGTSQSQKAKFIITRQGDIPLLGRDIMKSLNMKITLSGKPLAVLE